MPCSRQAKPFRLKRELTTQSSGFGNSLQQPRQPWDKQFAEATLLEDAAEDVVVAPTTITTGATNNGTIGKMTTTMTIDPVDHQGSDASIGTAAFVATTEVVAAMAWALVLFVVLHGIRPSNALRHVDASVPLPKEVYC
jgi:hypothetical protein